MTEIELPDGPFGVIYADPPWRYESGTTLKKWSIEEHYPTMDLEAIKALDVPAGEDCILYLWVTSPKLEEGLSVLNSWGFDYRTSAVWHKTNGLGMGHYFRIDHELLLVGRKGDAPSPESERLRTSVFEAPRGAHSEKPDAVRRHIQQAHPDARKLEMFARDGFIGWELWGNESPENKQQTVDAFGGAAVD